MVKWAQGLADRVLWTLVAERRADEMSTWPLPSEAFCSPQVQDVIKSFYISAFLFFRVSMEAFPGVCMMEALLRRCYGVSTAGVFLRMCAPRANCRLLVCEEMRGAEKPLEARAKDVQISSLATARRSLAATCISRSYRLDNIPKSGQVLCVDGGEGLLYVSCRSTLWLRGREGFRQKMRLLQ